MYICSIIYICPKRTRARSSKRTRKANIKVEGHMVGPMVELHLGGQVTFIANINYRPDRFLSSKTG